LGIAQKPEDKKKYDEILKKFADEDSLFHVPRRAHNGLFLYGDYFPQSQVSSYEITFRIAKSTGKTVKFSSYAYYIVFNEI
jgi:hypothetical protein